MALQPIKPTPEQCKIFFLKPDEPVLISGQAGSGKTSMAILRAAQLARFYQYRGITQPRIGFFVYNQTLRHYLESLASLYLADFQYEVTTLDMWCKHYLETHNLLPHIIAHDTTSKLCLQQAINFHRDHDYYHELSSLGDDFLIEEVRYIIGRFGYDAPKYIQSDREGRGTIPEISEELKHIIANDIIPSYITVLGNKNLIDWKHLHSLTFDYINLGTPFDKYDIIIVDEAQDLTAKQINILLRMISDNKSITFIRDTTQRIYKSNYLMADIEYRFHPEQCIELKKNYRNTKCIAQIAYSLISNEVEINDISLIDIDSIEISGSRPIWYRGKYTQQIRFLIQSINKIDYENESIGIFHIRDSDANDISFKLSNKGYPCSYIKEDRSNIYESGIYTSTLHSAKGLEFNHVFIIGFDEFFSPGSIDLLKNTSAHISSHRRLLYTAITRAKDTITILSSVNQYSPFLSEIDINLLEVINA